MLRLMKLIPLIGTLIFAVGARAEAVAPFDQLYLRSEARGSAYELAIARLAQERATRPEVKAYADTLVNEHEAYDAALRDLAEKKGVTLPPGLSAQGKAGVDKLAGQTGHRFDRAFIAEALRVNGAAIRDFRAEAGRTADPDIRSFVASYLPMDERHEATARPLAGTSVAHVSRMPIIRPPATGSAMPVIPPPVGGVTPVIPPNK
jgi:putative membrane protein